MSIWGFITGIFKPAVDLVDELHTSEEEKQTLKNHLFAMQAELSVKVLDYEARLIESQASVIKAEATADSWITRSWRPIVMLMFAFIIAWNYIIAPITGVASLPTPVELWSLMKLGLGGYIIGRSAEKVLPSILNQKKT